MATSSENFERSNSRDSIFFAKILITLGAVIAISNLFDFYKYHSWLIQDYSYLESNKDTSDNLTALQCSSYFLSESVDSALLPLERVGLSPPILLANNRMKRSELFIKNNAPDDFVEIKNEFISLGLRPLPRLLCGGAGALVFPGTLITFALFLIKKNAKIQ